MRAKLLDWLTFSGDVTTSRATFDAGGVVPLAPLVTARADLTARLPWGSRQASRCATSATATPTRSASRPAGGANFFYIPRRPAGPPPAVPPPPTGRHPPPTHAGPPLPL